MIKGRNEDLTAIWIVYERSQARATYFKNLLDDEATTTTNTNHSSKWALYSSFGNSNNNLP